MDNELKIYLIQNLFRFDKVLNKLTGSTWTYLRSRFLDRIKSPESNEELGRWSATDELIAGLLETEAAPLVRHWLNQAYNNEAAYRGIRIEFENLEKMNDIVPEPELEYAPPAENNAIPPGSEKTINAWIPELATPGDYLQPAHTYTLYFKVGDAVDHNLLTGDTGVAALDIPNEGLWLKCVVYSSTVEIPTPEFTLLVPKNGNSVTVSLPIITRLAGEAQLEVLLFTIAQNDSLSVENAPVKELYRKFQLRLQVGKPTGQIEEAEGGLIRNDWVKSPASQLNLPYPHEWTTPPGELNIVVIGGGKAYVSGTSGGKAVNKPMDWPVAPAQVAGLIENVVASAEKFRAKWDNYLNDLDATETMDRLRNFQPEYDWSYLNFRSDQSHEQAWVSAAQSPELKALAFDGYLLYETFFPSGSEIRGVMDELVAGHRINISWVPSGSDGFIPHVPWGLFYTQIPIDSTKAVDGGSFIGLRYRIEYTSHVVQAAPRTLGKVESTYSANLFYWGNNTSDPTYIEASWQQQQLANWQQQLIIPGAGSTNAKKELVSMLNQPAASPLGMIYFFCQCSVGDGNNPVLRFGSTSDAADVVNRMELGILPLQDRPLIFANACTTSTADAYMANELETSFFRRGCRAYLGTEIKVPIRFASRFACIFYNFFFRKVDTSPMAAGEAVAQTRLWLWTQYQNIGGLFYTYINQYELFMAAPEELKNIKNQ
ncbi:hypothetical protein A4H97_06865 [Niastella yeongjuensis]|uniref:CHAT domain-containing protein n=1 Tax=Niastella yeongjuensis TaxID=354355 RepID=A0A1V9EMB5_9BACT|nr:hypothetical protein [Niastella yeongjuensis]OQP47221.1 hypothetical protein A4H97_06865 [Niastella yeongjuensis]SEN74622.1 hypothetical protein SAMN05660816_01399 [Niastella yeongjuensis]